MRILLTGGGSGGHFYPLIAVAEEIIAQSKERKLLSPKIYFSSNEAYDEKALFDLDIEFVKIPAGKRRTYFSLKNFIDIFKTSFGVITAITKIYSIYPDVIFAKGGFASFPTLVAAKILKIPVVIHESDTVPGRVNKWAGKFAEKIAISFEETSRFFPDEKTALTGNPVRKEIMKPAQSGAHEFLSLEENIPTVLILGGSQGAQILNDVLVESLPQLLESYQIIHQTGEDNLKHVKDTSKIVLGDSPYTTRYKVFDFLNNLALRMSAGAADLVISRGGAGAIFEIASWGIPSIIVPISESNGDHQRRNAYNYARSRGAIVIEEKNLTSNILMTEIDRILNNPEVYDEMSEGAKKFRAPQAAEIIAKEIIKTGLSHE